LLRQAIPSATRDAVIGDLDEEFVEDVLPRLGATGARHWYWRQSFSLLFAFGSARLHAAFPGTAVGCRSDSMRQDLKDALRTIVRSPSYSIVTIVVLALGIGATSAIFSFVDGVLLRPLPYESPERIVMLWEQPPQGRRNVASTGNYLDWKRSNDVFETMAATRTSPVTLSGGGEPMQIPAGRVGVGYFDVFGARAALGRTFTPDEDQPGKDNVVVITHRFWVRQFGGDPGIVGRTLILDREPYTVIGVMPAGTAFDRGWNDLWRPLSFGPTEQNRNFHWLQVMARLKPGVTLEQARARMEPIAERIAREYPDSNKGWGVTIDRYVDIIVDDNLRQSLKVLMAAVGMLLLIGCANLANLALARGTGREREVVVRAALGASRGRLVRQFLTESLVLSFLGGLLGLALGYGMMRGLQMLLPALYLPREALVTIDMRALLFALGVSVATGLIFGTAPAFHAGRVDFAGSIKGSSRTVTADRLRRRLRDGLVVLEVALACMLLVGAGLLMRSFVRLQQVETTQDPERLIAAGMPMADSRWISDDNTRVFYRQILERTGAVPGTVSVALSSSIPMSGWGLGMPLRLGGRPKGAPGSQGSAGFKIVSPSYFQTVGLAIRRGRGLKDTDTSSSVPVIVVNQLFADRYFNGADPLGQQVFIEQLVPGKRRLGPEIPWQIVGVVANERVHSLNAPVTAGTYVPFEQSPQLGLSLLVRTATDPVTTIPAVKAAVLDVDPNQPLVDPRSIADIKNESVAPVRLRTWLIGLFGAIALLLAAVGIYGVISYSVAQRTHEIGVRAALGASRPRLIGLVMVRAAILTTIGLGAGILAAIASTTLLTTLLFGVEPRDTVSMIGAAVTLGLVALFAAWVPARRAAAVDPLVALRSE
jgi:putative ABC transport system permease protein